MTRKTIDPKTNLLRAIKRQSPAWVPDGLDGPVYLKNVVTIYSPVSERPASAGLDAFGVDWSYKAGAEGGTYPTEGRHPIKDIRDWEKLLRIPEIHAGDWSRIRAEAEAVDRETNLVMGFVEMGLFERSYLLLGMEAALVAYMLEPDLMYGMLGRIADYKIELIERFHDEARLDMVWFGDDWGMQTNLFIPPDRWRSVIKPHLKRIYDCMKERGILINQHSCGKIESVFEDMVELGADLWNPCQPCNDLAMLKRKYGDRISFHGGIDSQFVLDRPGATPEEVRNETRRVIDILGPGGGYIAGPSHSVPHDPVLLNALEEELWNYGGSFYTKAVNTHLSR